MCLGVQSLHDRNILHRDLKVNSMCTACALYVHRDLKVYILHAVYESDAAQPAAL